MSGFPQPSIVPANGYGITGNTGLTPTPAVGLTVASGSIGANVPLPGGTVTKVFDTAALGIGTWLVNAGCTFLTPAATAQFELTIAVDTAVATITGPFSGEFNPTTSLESETYQMHLSAIVVITTAGTLQLKFANLQATATTALAATGSESYAGATGYTAIRIA